MVSDLTVIRSILIVEQQLAVEIDTQIEVLRELSGMLSGLCSVETQNLTAQWLVERLVYGTSILQLAGVTGMEGMVQSDEAAPKSSLKAQQLEMGENH